MWLEAQKLRSGVWAGKGDGGMGYDETIPVLIALN